MCLFSVSLLNDISNIIWLFANHCGRGPKRLLVFRDLGSYMHLQEAPSKVYSFFCSCGLLSEGREAVYSATSAYICFILPDVTGLVLDCKLCSEHLRPVTESVYFTGVSRKEAAYIFPTEHRYLSSCLLIDLEGSPRVCILHVCCESY